MAHPNEDLVRRGYAAFEQGDMDTLRTIMTPDVVHHVDGNNAISGDHTGIDAVLGYYGKMFEETDGKLSAELKSVTVEGDNRVVVVHRAKAERVGKTIDVDETLEFTIQDGKVARIDESSADQAAEDEFWA